MTLFRRSIVCSGVGSTCSSDTESVLAWFENSSLAEPGDEQGHDMCHV